VKTIANIAGIAKNAKIGKQDLTTDHTDRTDL
jgi:hypothetical protein